MSSMHRNPQYSREQSSKDQECVFDELHNVAQVKMI